MNETRKLTIGEEFAGMREIRLNGVKIAMYSEIDRNHPERPNLYLSSCGIWQVGIFSVNTFEIDGFGTLRRQVKDIAEAVDVLKQVFHAE